MAAVHMGIRSHSASHTALALPYSPRSSSAPTKRLHASRVNMPSQLHVSGQCTEAHGSAPGKTFQQSLRNAAAEARRGDHGIMYGRAFLIQKLIQGRPARNQTILKSSIMCMGEHFFSRNALLTDVTVKLLAPSENQSLQSQERVKKRYVTAATDWFF